MWYYTEGVKSLHSVKFSRSIWKKLHWAENIYTGTACGACDKYRLCSPPYIMPNWTLKRQTFKGWQTILLLEKRFFQEPFRISLGPPEHGKRPHFSTFFEAFYFKSGIYKISHSDQNRPSWSHHFRRVSSSLSRSCVEIL